MKDYSRLPGRRNILRCRAATTAGQLGAAPRFDPPNGMLFVVSKSPSGDAQAGAGCDAGQSVVAVFGRGAH